MKINYVAKNRIQVFSAENTNTAIIFIILMRCMLMNVIGLSKFEHMVQ